MTNPTYCFKDATKGDYGSAPNREELFSAVLSNVKRAAGAVEIEHAVNQVAALLASRSLAPHRGKSLLDALGYL